MKKINDMPNTKIQVVIEAIDKTREAFTGVEEGLKRMNAKMKNAEKSSLAFAGGLTVLAAGVGLLAKQAIDAAAQYEQSHIAFSTMLGSAEEATILLNELADFARRTPFELVGIEASAKQLLAMGIEADNLLPTLKSLGDVSAGLSVPISRLALNFGQVKTQGKLTGRELRDFSIAGVPLISALVDVLNEMGGNTEMVGETSKKAKTEINKFTKSNESAQKRIERLNLTLIKQQNRLKEMTDKGVSVAKKKMDGLTLTLEKQNNRLSEMIDKGKDGTASFKNLKISIESNEKKLKKYKETTDKSSVAFTNLNISITETRSKLLQSGETLTSTGKKLAELGPISKGVSTQINITKEDIADMVSAGEIGFDLVEKAFQRMTEEGGRFENLMEKQSTTLVGMVENLKDAWNLFLREEGKELLEWAKQFVAGVIDIVDNVLPKWIDEIKEIIKFFKEHKEVLIVLISTVVGGLTPAIYGAIVAFATLALSLAPFLIGGAIIGGLVAGMLWLKENWKQVADFFIQTWEGLKIIASETIDPIIDKFGEFLDIINEIKLTFNIIKTAISNFKFPGLLGGFKIPSFQQGGIVPGPVGAPIPAIVHGGEKIIPVGGESGNTFNFNFEGAFIGNPEQFTNKIIDLINRESELKALGGQ